MAPLAATLAVTLACGPGAADTDATSVTETSATSATSDGDSDSDSSGETTTATTATTSSESTDGVEMCALDEDCVNELAPHCCLPEDQQEYSCEPWTCFFRFCDYGCCPMDRFELGGPRPGLVLTLDKSGSMFDQDQGLDHDLDPMTPPQSRWRTVHEGISEFLGATNGSIDAGAQLFPSVDAVVTLGPQACVVESPPEVPVSPMNAATLLSLIPPANDTSGEGGTPAAAAVRSAVEHLNEVSLAEGAPRYIVLITDGAANCREDAQTDVELLEYDESLVTAIADAVAQPGAPIHTAVIGVAILDELDDAGVNPHETLNAAALAGGLPLDGPTSYHNVHSEQELRDALDAVQDEALPCELTLPTPPPNNQWLVLEVDGLFYEDPISLDECDDGLDGWAWLSEDEDAVRLCGALCAAYRLHGVVEGEFLCPIYD